MKVIADSVPQPPVKEVTITLSLEEAEQLYELVDRIWGGVTLCRPGVSLDGCGSVTSNLWRELGELAL